MIGERVATVTEATFDRVVLQAEPPALVEFWADWCPPCRWLGPIVDDLAAERFLNGDVRHRGRWRSAVPMLLVRRKPDHVARPDFFDRTTLALRPAEPGGDDQRLTERMRMPGGASTRLERDACATNARRFRRFEQRIDSHCAGEPISGSFSGRL